MVEILVTDEFETWYLELNSQDDAAVMRALTKRMLPLAERLWADYLKSIEKELEA